MSSALETSLREIAARLEQGLVAEEISHRKGLLQSLDARTRVLSCLALVLAANLSRSLAPIAGLYAITALVAWASAVPVGAFMRRVWLAVPLFTGLAALPALFLTPGPPLLYLPWGWVVTRTGGATVAFLLLRVSTSLALTTLVILTTPWAALLRALSVLRVPDTVVLILGMTYRYIYVLLRVTNDMFLSRRSRVVGRLASGDVRRLEGAMAGALLTRSLDLSGEVYLAMQSRGFRGYGRSLRGQRFSWRDALCGALVLLIVAAVLLPVR